MFDFNPEEFSWPDEEGTTVYNQGVECYWADGELNGPPAPRFTAEDVQRILYEQSIDNEWDSEYSVLYELKDGTYGYLSSWNDTTFWGGSAYRSHSLENILTWAIGDENREEVLLIIELITGEDYQE